MAYCCSQCNFTAQFESALIMHHQLHHESEALNGYQDVNKPKLLMEKSRTVPRAANLDASFSGSKDTKGFRLTGRTSATRLFEKLRFRIGRVRSRSLFSHPEENNDGTLMNDLSCASECTSKAISLDTVSKSLPIGTPQGDAFKETFGCHLCKFDADRITVLDRHLLNDHKIGLDNLLKLVMAKTKDGLSEDCTSTAMCGIRQPYYKPQNEMIEEGEFVIENVTPAIKILKHTATNTDIQWTDIPDLKDNCRKMTEELEKLMKHPTSSNQDGLLAKMQTLSDCMCKFVSSTNIVKKVLAKEYESKSSVRDRLSVAEPFFELGLGDQDSPRDWERAHSERMARTKHNYGNNSRGGKSKLSSESFYF